MTTKRCTHCGEPLDEEHRRDVALGVCRGTAKSRALELTAVWLEHPSDLREGFIRRMREAADKGERESSQNAEQVKMLRDSANLLEHVGAT